MDASAILSNDGDNDGENDGVKLTENQSQILKILQEDKNLTIEELAEKVGITDRNIEKNIAKLKKYGFLKRIGTDRAGHWEVI